jgi:hypothetical protein
MIPALSGIREVPVAIFRVPFLQYRPGFDPCANDSGQQVENDPGPGGKVSSVWPYELKWTVHLSGRVLYPKGPWEIGTKMTTSLDMCGQ